ncbi:AMP-binding protein, partial [Streptomyces coffeae]
LEQLDLGIAKFDLSFNVQERHDKQGAAGVHGVLEYNGDLFDRESATALAGRFERLLRALMADPERPLSRVDLLAEDERQRILVDWNATAVAGAPAGLPELFEAQVARTPEAIAVADGARTLSYAQLDACANGIAQRLIAHGIGPEDLVAVAAPRSVALLAALLGVAKAGAAYLPVDPEYPAERIAHMLRDAVPALLLTAGEQTAEREEFGSLPRVHLDDVRPAENGPADRDRIRPLLPHHPAYVIYTSGSTGLPKGVVVEHGALADYLRWAGRSYPSAGGTALLHSSVSFDMTVTTLFTPLTVGGRVCVGALDDTAPPDTAPTLLKATPSHLALLDALPPHLSPTGDLLLAGEALTAEALERWRAAHPAVTVRNVYGPTETTVSCAEYRLPPGATPDEGPLPIGRPLANTRLYVLGPGLRPVPVGVPGELYVAGAGLA